MEALQKRSRYRSTALRWKKYTEKKHPWQETLTGNKITYKQRLTNTRQPSLHPHCAVTQPKAKTENTQRQPHDTNTKTNKQKQPFARNYRERKMYGVLPCQGNPGQVDVVAAGAAAAALPPF